MPLSVTTSVTGGGLSISTAEQVPGAVTASLNPSPPLAVAKTGSLTGTTLTMDPGHGFSTADRLDVFWADPTTGLLKCRYKATAGTVATNSVPLTGGAGDALPAGPIPVTVQKPTPFAFPFAPANLQGLAAGALAPGKIVLEKADGTVVYHRTFAAGGAGTVWTVGSGGANPVSDTCATAFVSNASATLTNAVSALATVSA